MGIAVNRDTDGIAWMQAIRCGGIALKPQWLLYLRPEELASIWVSRSGWEAATSERYERDEQEAQFETSGASLSQIEVNGKAIVGHTKSSARSAPRSRSAS